MLGLAIPEKLTGNRFDRVNSTVVAPAVDAATV
jgi:hypothetical protein